MVSLNWWNKFLTISLINGNLAVVMNHSVINTDIMVILEFCEINNIYIFIYIYIFAFLLEQVITLSITGALNAVFTEEHKKEIRRYIYNHQASIDFYFLLSQINFELHVVQCIFPSCLSCFA